LLLGASSARNFTCRAKKSTLSGRKLLLRGHSEILALPSARRLSSLGSVSETGFILLLANLRLKLGAQFPQMLAFYISFNLSLMK
jgi:hypothetical protein